MKATEWATLAIALASALAAIAAIFAAIHSTRKTLWLTALTSLEQRFSAINHAKIADPASWESIKSGGHLNNAAKHLIFETFQFYHQAFHLCLEHAISPADYEMWRKRMARDLELFSSYREWWRSDQPKYHDCWHREFIAVVNCTLDSLNNNKTDEIAKQPNS